MALILREVINMYIYIYKEKEYNSWYSVKTLQDFHNVSFPIEEKLTDEILSQFGITRKNYTPPAPTPEQIVEEKQKTVRMKRDEYLLATDYSQLPDVPLSKTEKSSYKEYREYLRTYTDNDKWWEQYPKTYEEWKNV